MRFARSWFSSCCRWRCAVASCFVSFGHLLQRGATPRFISRYRGSDGRRSIAPAPTISAHRMWERAVHH
jgi:hypothetical protein